MRSFGSINAVADPPGLLTQLVMQGLALIGAGIAAYLGWASIAGEQLVGCTGDARFSCEHVLNSAWSKWFGLPVGFAALVAYASLFVALLFIGPNELPLRRVRVWRVLISLAVAAAGAALWFLSLQIFPVRSFCAYCAGVHGCGLVLAVMIFWHSPMRQRGSVEPAVARLTISGRSATKWAGVGALSLPMLIAGQLLSPEPDWVVEQASLTTIESMASVNVRPPSSTSQQGPSTGTRPTANRDRPRGMYFGFIFIDVNQVPLSGSPEAPHVIVKMFDYTCHHCRRLHHELEHAFERYGDQLGVALLPVPLDHDCNDLVQSTPPQHRYACELAEIALAVWSADSDAFAEFHHWLFEPETPPTPDDARRYAAQLVGAAALDEAVRDPAVGQQIKDAVAIYKRSGDKRGLPKMLIGNGVTGRPPSEAALMDMLEEKLGVRPLAP